MENKNILEKYEYVIFFHFESEGYVIYIFIGKAALYLLRNFLYFKCFSMVYI